MEERVWWLKWQWLIVVVGLSALAGIYVGDELMGDLLFAIVTVYIVGVAAGFLTYRSWRHRGIVFLVSLMWLLGALLPLGVIYTMRV